MKQTECRVPSELLPMAHHDQAEDINREQLLILDEYFRSLLLLRKGMMVCF